MEFVAKFYFFFLTLNYHHFGHELSKTPFFLYAATTYNRIRLYFQ